MSGLPGDALGEGPFGLELDGAPLAPLAARLGTPLYVYGGHTLRRRFAALRQALGHAGRPAQIRYAMKANRYGPVLDRVRAEGDLRIDACSPREVERALQHGFEPHEVSLTAGMLSNRDLATVARYGVRPNLDTFSALRRWAATPDRGAAIGLRLNPEVSVGWGQEPKLAYGNSKFGFDQAALPAAVAEARALGLVVEEVHMHLGWGLQRGQADLLRQAFSRLAALAGTIDTLRTVNVGGGLGWPHRRQDDPLPLDAWGALVGEALAPLDPAIAVACEPGTYVAAAAGVLVVEVNTVETRQSGRWVGVDAGHGINVFAAHYGIPLITVPVRGPRRAPTEVIHLAGNINEANDIFARDLPLPEVAEGDLLAFWPAGAYGASMASDHCLRGRPAEVLVEPPRPAAR
ncbi:MAG: alanine racemase [Myxococcales bacterium]|nr:alanine racemase [Myxococcales bacterium]